MKKVEIFSTFCENTENYKNSIAVASRLLCEGKQKDILCRYRQTTPERAGMISVIKALKALGRKADITVYTDSKFIVDAIKKDWMCDWVEKNDRKRANFDLWKVIYKLTEEYKIEFEWAKPSYGNIADLKAAALNVFDNIPIKKDTVYENSGV